jgi:predicted nuclease of predicted toxin-antitoxin system
LRFLLDEDVSPAVAEAARGLDLDVVSVHEIDRRGFTDRDQLDFAASQGRVFVTRNRDDFIKLTVSSYRAGDRHPGVVIIPYSLPNKEPGRIAHALKEWNEQHGDAETRYGIFFLQG